MADPRPPAPPATTFALPANMMPFYQQQFATLTPQMQQQLLQSHLMLSQQQQQLAAQLAAQQGTLRPQVSTAAATTLPLPATGGVVPAAATMPAPGAVAPVAPAGATPAAGAAPKLPGPPASASALPPPQPLSVAGAAGAAAGGALPVGGVAAAAEEGPVVMLPPAEATHEQVVADQELFVTTLMRLQTALGIVDKVPIINSRVLDLHLLYCTVTAKGGMEEVVQRKAWKEVSSAFNFPETITSSSFQLRKAYVALLWDYEQVYYKRKTGPRIPPPPGTYKPSAARAAAAAAAADGTTPKTGSGRGRKRKDPAAAVAAAAATAGTPGAPGSPAVPGAAGDATPAAVGAAAAAAAAPPEYPGLAPGAPTALTAVATTPGEPDASLVVGGAGTVSVDAKFDCGYFVTVKLGGHDFRGMLYFPPPEHTQGAGGRAGRKASDDGSASPLVAPKQGRTAFAFFCQDARGKLLAENPGLGPAEVQKKLGEMWGVTGEAEKAPYVTLASQDRQRYIAEVEAYNYRLASRAALQQAREAEDAVATAQAHISLAAATGGQLQGLVAATPAGAQQQQQQQPGLDEAMHDAEQAAAAAAAQDPAGVAAAAATAAALAAAGMPFGLAALPAGAVPVVGAAPDAAATGVQPGGLQPQ